MLPNNDLIRLQHMRDAALEALRYSQGRSRADLDSDTMLARALVKCVEIVGEAAARISQETQVRIPSFPWAGMVGMRNWLIHDYFDIDLDHVWATVVEDLPPLIEQLERILADESGSM